MIILLNGQLAIPSIERALESQSFCWGNPCLLSCSPFCNGGGRKRTTVNFSIKQSYRDNAQGQLSGGQIPDRDSEFRPSFNEYLKVLESFKSDRDKKEPQLNPIEQPRVKRQRHPRTQDKTNTVHYAPAQEQTTRTEYTFTSSRASTKNVEVNIDFDDEKLVKKHVRDESTTRTNNHKHIKLDESKQLWRRKREPVEIKGFGENTEERAAFRNVEDLDGVIGKPQVSKKEMEERIQALAKALNGADIDIPEWMFSKIIRSARIKFTDYTMLRVIQILGKYGNWRRVLQIIDWIQTRERYKSNRLRYVYTTALDILGKSRRPVEAFNLFCAMQQQICCYPDIVAYHSVAVTLGQSGHMKELFAVIDAMRSFPTKNPKAGNWDPRLEPDIVVYNAVLNACAKRKQFEGAFWVWQQLKEHNQKPTAATYGLIMEVMFACEKYNLVHDFFKRLQKSSIPNACAYKVMVNTLWKEGKMDEAMASVEEMERRGIVGSASLYYDLGRCLCSAGKPQEAISLVPKICHVATKPMVVTYTGLLQASADAGHIDDALFIFNHMKQFCSPNLVTCNIMLKSLIDHNRFDEATALFRSMVEPSNRGLNPDTYTFNTMLEACESRAKWDDFAEAYESMLAHGHNFNPKRHVSMVLNASRGGHVAPLEMTWKEFKRFDRIPPVALIKNRFCWCLEKGDHRAALGCLEFDFGGDVAAFSKKAWRNLIGGTVHRFTNESLALLVDEGDALIRTHCPNFVIRNLIESCRELLKVH